MTSDAGDRVDAGRYSSEPANLCDGSYSSEPANLWGGRYSSEPAMPSSDTESLLKHTEEHQDEWIPCKITSHVCNGMYSSESAVPAVAIGSPLKHMLGRKEGLFRQFSEPAMPSSDIGSLLKHMGERQENLFRLVLAEQHACRRQLTAMKDDLIREVREVAVKSEKVGKGIQRSHSVITAEKQIQRSHSVMTAERLGIVPGLLDSVTPKSMAKQTSFLFESQGETPAAAKYSMDSIGSGETRGTTRLARSLSFGMQHSAEQATDWRARVDRLLRSNQFEIAVASAIVLNALIMCWEVQYQGLDVGFNLKYPGRASPASVVWPRASTVFAFFDWFFGCAFCVEMVVKLCCWQCRYFCRDLDAAANMEVPVPWKQASGNIFARCKGRCMCISNLQGWNLLDFVCVIAFLLSKCAAVFEEGINPQMPRLLRLVRLGRLVRLLRFLESLDHLYVMTTAIAGLRQVLLWAVVLLTTMLLTCALFLIQILHATYFDGVEGSELSEDRLQKHHAMYEYFGTCTRCMLSMFEITLGNWPPVARLLSEEVSEWFTLFCLVHKLTIGFAVVGVITGVILQETFKVAQTDDIIMFRQKRLANLTLRNKMAALFASLDKDGSGTLDFEELQAITERPEIEMWLNSLGVETGDLRTLFKLIDEDGSGLITIDELIERVPRIQGNARSLDVLAIQQYLITHSGKMKDGAQKRSFTDTLLCSPSTGSPTPTSPRTPISNARRTLARENEWREQQARTENGTSPDTSSKAEMTLHTVE